MSPRRDPRHRDVLSSGLRPEPRLGRSRGPQCPLRSLATEDIDWVRGTVHVIGKFRKERDVPMQPDANEALKEQLEEEGKLWKQNPQRLREVLAEGSARAKIPSLTPH